MVAREFLAWLAIPSGQTWGDIGCGTGALVQGMLATAEPQAIFAIDKSKGFIATARSAIPDQLVRFAVADAAKLPWASGSCDATVSGLVLNFVPDTAGVVREMARVTRPNGLVAAYVWDYSGGMEMMRHFWNAAIEVSPADAALDQAERFPICQPEPLRALFQGAGLTGVAVRPIAIPTVFRDFDDYWTPFLGKQGAAPTYLASLDDKTRDQIRDRLMARLPIATDGSITMTAQAWAVRGIA
jgi:SAM-dependent methyltransferase